MKKADIVIIGAGLVGSMTAKVLRSEGLSVLIIDNKELQSASKCSSGVWKDGWLNDKLMKYYKEGRAVLEEFGNVQKLEFFNMDKETTEDFHFIDTYEMLEKDFIVETIDKIKGNILFANGKPFATAKEKIVVCAGAWTDELLISSGLQPVGIDKYWGAMFRYKAKLDISRYATWSPYKQILVTRRSDEEFLFSDGSTVKNPKPQDERINKVSDRLIQHFNQYIGVNFNEEHCTGVYEGLRPYLIDKEKDFVNIHGKFVVSATGGAKNTTILSGYMAKRINEIVHNIV